MHHALKYQRPVGRIDHVLSRLKRLWHYYPGRSLRELVMEVSIYANHAKSDLPLVSMDCIEDIAYPDGHFLEGTRHLEMGIDWLENDLKDEPLPPVPFHIGTIDTVAEFWRRQPQMRLAQLLHIQHFMAEEREAQRSANGTR